MGTRRQFSREFKLEAVRLVKERGVTVAQAGPGENGPAHDYVALHRGTKGGRLRHVPVIKPEQHAALDQARRVARKEDESLSDSYYSLVSAIRHLRYEMERFGITKRALGVTPHGLRHGFAAARNETEAGVPAQVQTAERAPAEVDAQARLIVSGELGHSRRQITSVYLSSSRALVKQPDDTPR